MLVGIGVGEHQFVIGPKVHNWTFFGAETSSGGAVVNLLSVGTSLGFAAKLGKIVVLMPEINVLYPLWASGTITGAAAGGGLSEFAAEGVFLEFGVSVGFRFGKAAPAPAPTAPAPAPAPAPATAEPADDGYDDTPPADPAPEPTPAADPDEEPPDAEDGFASDRS